MRHSMWHLSFCAWVTSQNKIFPPQLHLQISFSFADEKILLCICTSFLLFVCQLMDTKANSIP